MYGVTTLSQGVHVLYLCQNNHVRFNSSPEMQMQMQMQVRDVPSALVSNRMYGERPRNLNTSHQKVYTLYVSRGYSKVR